MGKSIDQMTFYDMLNTAWEEIIIGIAIFVKDNLKALFPDRDWPQQFPQFNRKEDSE